MAEFIIPSVRMRFIDECNRSEGRFYCRPLEPFAPRHSITYFDNRKPDSTESAYQRLHNIEGFDPKKPRCDQARQSLYWEEISREEDGHKVPMTTNHWHGRPNRIQVDDPGRKFNRTTKMRELYTRKQYTLECENRHEVKACANTN